MAKYTLTYMETYRRTYIVEANSYEEAEENLPMIFVKDEKMHPKSVVIVAAMR